MDFNLTTSPSINWVIITSNLKKPQYFIAFINLNNTKYN